MNITGLVYHRESGIAQNFAVPVTYTVTAEDGSTQVYTVTVESPVAGIATSGGNTSFTGDKAVVVDPNLLLIGDDLDGARVMIENMKPGDVLGYTGALPGGVSGRWMKIPVY